ncbi:hypothetical protein GW17_00045972 [Ensete ventricosum]|nr:hypothetical protein GW17_00045972 [Ensete ventricosum]
MASSSTSSSSSPSTYSPRNRSRFGDTTFTKVFVGGLAWETPTEELRRYFEQFGQILEAVIITDKITGRSKGYGFFINLHYIQIFLGVSRCLMHGYLLKQAAAYNPQMASSYYEELYGPTSPSPAVAPPYRHPHMAFSQQTARASFPSPAHGRRPPYAQHPAPHAPISTPTPPHGIQNTTAGYHHLNPLPSMFAYDEASTFLRDFDTT